MKKYSGPAGLAMIVIAVIAIGGIAAIGTTRCKKHLWVSPRTEGRGVQGP
jgi:hypothetical protein